MADLSFLLRTVKMRRTSGNACLPRHHAVIPPGLKCHTARAWGRTEGFRIDEVWLK